MKSKCCGTGKTARKGKTMKNILPDSMQPYGLVYYKGKWYITVNGQGSSVNVFKTKAEALFVVEQLYKRYTEKEQRP